MLLLFTSRSEIFFITGLIAFLISHLLFIQVYRHHRGSNTERELILSERLKNELETLGAKSGIEYLPLSLRLATGQTLPFKYYIPHFLERPDSIDSEASGVEYDIMDPTSIDSVKRLCLKSDPKLPFFKFAGYNDIVVVRMDIAEHLTNVGFSGIRWLPLYNHPNFDESKRDTPLWKKIDDLYRAIWEKGKPQKAPPIDLPKRERARPPADVKKWVVGLTENSVQKSSVSIERVYPALGDDIWLDAYNDDKESWPAFDPKRYYPILSNRQGNYWLLDLEENAKVVYYSHEEGYNEQRNFATVAESFDDFKKMVNAESNPPQKKKPTAKSVKKNKP